MTFPELIIFDCDGVLVDSEMISNRLLAEHLTRYGFEINAQQCRQRFIGYSMAKVIAEVKAEGINLPDEFETLLKQNDQKTFAAELKPIPGVAKTLAQLAHKKCVASSGSPDKIRTNLTLTGLIEFFEPHLFSAHMVKNSKPAPDLFLHAASCFDIDPKNCLVIEDTPIGVGAALAAGMAVLGFAGGSHCDAAHTAQLTSSGSRLVFDHMQELPEIVANVGWTR